MVDKRSSGSCPACRMRSPAIPVRRPGPRHRARLLGLAVRTDARAVDVLSASYGIALLHFSELLPFPAPDGSTTSACSARRSSRSAWSRTPRPVRTADEDRDRHAFSAHVRKFDGRPFTGRRSGEGAAGDNHETVAEEKGMSTTQDFTGQVPAWCPGCGTFRSSRPSARHDRARIEPTGNVGFRNRSAAKFPHYTRGNTFNGLHGRALPVATGSGWRTMRCSCWSRPATGTATGKAAIISWRPCGGTST